MDDFLSPSSKTKSFTEKMHTIKWLISFAIIYIVWRMSKLYCTIFAKNFYDDLLFKFKVSRSTIDHSFLLKVPNMDQLFCRKKRTVLKLNRPKQGVKPSNSVCSTWVEYCPFGLVCLCCVSAIFCFYFFETTFDWKTFDQETFDRRTFDWKTSN